MAHSPLVEDGWLSDTPRLKDVCDSRIIFDVSERIEANKAGHQHDVKTFARCRAIPVGHRQDLPIPN
jgi:hypothetical protein